MNMMIGRFFLLFLLLCPVHITAQKRAMITGKILSTEKEIVDFATVYLKGTTYGGTTNEKGIPPKSPRRNLYIGSIRHRI